MAMAVRLEPNPSALHEMLRAQGGAVGRHLTVRGTQVQERAKQQVGYSDNPDPSHGHLRDTIVKRFGNSNGELSIFVGSDHPIALLHHEGTSPHEIIPRNAQVLRFTIGGTVVFATHVSHPGTKPNRYLTDALQAIR